MQVMNPAEQIETLQQRVSQVGNLLIDVTQEKVNLSNAYGHLQQTSAANNQRVIETCAAVRAEIKKSVKEPAASNLCAMFDALVGPMAPEQKHVDADPVA
jgi:hypothetical protein